MNFNDTFARDSGSNFGGTTSFNNGFGMSGGGGGGNVKSKREQIWEEKRKQREAGMKPQSSQFQPAGPSSIAFKSPQVQVLDFATDNSDGFYTSQTQRKKQVNFDGTSSFSSPSKKRNKKVTFALPKEEIEREKLKFEEPNKQHNRMHNTQNLRSSLKSETSDEDQRFTPFASTLQQPQNFFEEPHKSNNKSNLTSQNVAYFNDENAESEQYNYMKRSASQPNVGQQQAVNFEQNSLNNDSQNSDSMTSIPKYSPVKRSNPNKKYVPTNQFVVGEGTQEDKGNTNFLIQKNIKEKTYQQELQQQMEEKRLTKENERKRLKDEELEDERRIKRELLELQQKEQMEKDSKRKQLGDIMDRYQVEERNKMKNVLAGGEGNEIMIKPPQQEQPRQIPVDLPPGAQYAKYVTSEEDDPNHYDYQQDFQKFDILNRGHRAAVSGVPRAKLLADIGHDLKHSVKNEVDKIRSSIRVQHMDFKDQLEKMTTEAKIAIEERDRVKNHLHLLRNELRNKREEQMQQENNLIKTLNKYQFEPQRYHYPQRPFHLEHTAPKPEEKKTIYEKLFFDKIENKIESEKLNPPLNLYREATQNPHAQITIGQSHYFANSKGQLNTESTLVTLDNKQLFPQKPIYEMPDLQSKTTIVDWQREPYEYYHSKVKDINPRSDMFIVKNNYESKFATKIGDSLNYQRFALPEREEHRPQYNKSIKPIDLANINIEKIHQVNELRLSKLDRDYRTNPHAKSKQDIDVITDLLSLKM